MKKKNDGLVAIAAVTGSLGLMAMFPVLAFVAVAGVFTYGGLVTYYGQKKD
jgi:type III secretory pathway component EscV